MFSRWIGHKDAHDEVAHCPSPPQQQKTLRMPLSLSSSVVSLSSTSHTSTLSKGASFHFICFSLALAWKFPIFLPCFSSLPSVQFSVVDFSLNFTVSAVLLLCSLLSWLCCCFSSCCHFLFLHLGVCLFRLLSIFLLFFLLNALYQLHSSCHRFKPSFTLKLALVSHGLIYFLFYLLIFLIRLLLPYYFEIWRGGVGGK